MPAKRCAQPGCDFKPLAWSLYCSIHDDLAAENDALQAKVRRMQDIPTRSYPADEITKDPIFLLQRRRWQLMEEPYGWSIVDEETLQNLETDETLSMTWEDCKGFEEAFDYWETEHVFFTRAEAEQWGKSHDYRFSDGWRVYCVVAKGELVKLLDVATIRSPD